MLDLLLLDPTNPRALAFQLAVLERHAASLPAGPNPEGVAELQQRLAALPAKLEAVRAEAFDAEADMAGERPNGWPALPRSWAVCPTC